MKQKYNSWAEEIGYKVGGISLLAGIFLGIAIADWSLFYKLYYGNFIKPIDILIKGFFALMIFIGIWLIGIRKFNFGLDEKDIKRKILEEGELCQ